MRVVRGLDPLLCLLLLVLLDPHSPEMGHLPQRRFEYKLSFKGPRLALPGVGIPFWSHHGGKMSGEDQPFPVFLRTLERLTGSGWP